MTRSLLNLLTALSLLLCVAAVVNWRRGYRVTDNLYLCWPSGPLVSLDSRAGQVSAVVQRRQSWLPSFTYYYGPRHDYPVRNQLRFQPPGRDRDSVRFFRFALCTSSWGGS